MHCRRLLSARAIRSLAWCHAPHARRSLMVKTKAEVVPAFYAVVNMSRDELEEWLDTPRSNAVGQKLPGADESTGHQSGRKILELLSKSDQEWDDEDVQHAAKVIGYVHRHKAQCPAKSAEEIEHTKWAASLKNWGHDPMKDEDVQARHG